MQNFTVSYMTEIYIQAVILCRAIMNCHTVGMEMAIEMMLAAAFTNLAFSRTIAMLVTEVMRNLTIPAAREVQERLTKAALTTFYGYWNDHTHYCRTLKSSELIRTVDPFAISAFIGDLYNAEHISFGEFSACVDGLIDRITLPIHLECLYQLLVHGGSNKRSEFGSAFLSHCLGRIERACIRSSFLEMETKEEQALKRLLYDFSVRMPGYYLPDYSSMELNLTDALQTLISMPWLYDKEFGCVSPSTSPCDSYRADDEPTLYMPRPIRAAKPCILTKDW